jgi:hypothetical protein
MTDRVTRLRKQSLEAVPRLSDERARLMTEFYRTYAELTSTPVMRARSFHYLLDHMTIGIQPGELIVGEKGPCPKATPTYPELCCHSLSDLDLLDSRAKLPYKVEFWPAPTMKKPSSPSGTAGACASASLLI